MFAIFITIKTSYSFPSCHQIVGELPKYTLSKTKTVICQYAKELWERNTETDLIVAIA